MSKTKQKKIVGNTKNTSKILEVSEFMPDTSHKTTKYMSIYEYSALINARALQLFKDKPKIDTKGETDLLRIAEQEIKSRRTNLVVRRKLPNGQIDTWLASDMEFPDL